MANKRNCIVCGAEYDFCPKCNHDLNLKWKINYDTECCRDLSSVISGYNMGVKTIDDVKYVVGKYDIKDCSKYTEGIQKVIKMVNYSTPTNTPINEEPAPTKKIKKKKWFNEPANMDIELNEELNVETKSDSE